MRILLTGGGTFGSVTPLFAIIEELKKDGESHQFIWIGTKDGQEKEFIEKKGIEFKGINSGKLRRYFSLKNITDIARMKLGVFESVFIIQKFKPDVILSAGSFVSVPVAIAGRLLRKPILIHQLDVRPGLANKIMSFFATKITVGFSGSLNSYPAGKTVWTGNPTRHSLSAFKSKEELRKKFNLCNELPVLLVLGGGTGALPLNKLIAENLSELAGFCQIIHITGREKNIEAAPNENYHSFEFLDDLSEAYAVADGVISRAGVGTLSELAVLKIPTVLMPIPNSHQEDNADAFLEAGAVLILDQNKITAEKIIGESKKILYNEKLRRELSENMGKMAKGDAANKIVKIIRSIAK